MVNCRLGYQTLYYFAKEIFSQSNISIDLKPIPTTAYPTPAKRPAYSVLDKTKLKSTFNIEIKEWQTSLISCLNQL
jgi:dTDP-4-dehydrorhamnose reductase